MKKKIKEVIKKLYKILKRPEMIVLPGQIAFFLILSIVPTISLLSYIASLFHLSMDFVYNFITKMFNEDIASLFISKGFGNGVSTSIVITMIIAYYIASKAASSIIVTSNTLYKIEQKPFIYRKIKSMFMIFIIIMLLVFMLIVPVFGNKILELIKYVNGGAEITTHIQVLLHILKSPVYWLVTFFVIKTIFTMAPDEPIPSSKMNKGAIFTTFAWVLISAIYSFYVTHYARYSIYYGSLATIVVLMIWFYLLSIALTVGIAINSEEINYQKKEEFKEDNSK